MEDYLRPTTIIDCEHPAIRELATSLAGNARPVGAASRCFRWVRDEIRHSSDFGDNRVTMIASDVLRHRTGLCYAKSHLLAAMLRAISIPCGFAYQRLVDDESRSGFCLHGLNAVWLTEHGWYRIDPRGNRTDLATSFDPPIEHLAFVPQQNGERTIDRVFSDPLTVVVETLSKYDSVSKLCDNLPDCLGEQAHARESPG